MVKTQSTLETVVDRIIKGKNIPMIASVNLAAVHKVESNKVESGYNTSTSYVQVQVPSPKLNSFVTKNEN